MSAMYAGRCTDATSVLRATRALHAACDPVVRVWIVSPPEIGRGHAWVDGQSRMAGWDASRGADASALLLATHHIQGHCL